MEHDFFYLRYLALEVLSAVFVQRSTRETTFYFAARDKKLTRSKQRAKVFRDRFCI